LDALLADQPLAGGLEPRLGSAHLRTLSVVGFPSSTFPGILDELNRLAFPYRWVTRAVCMDKTDAAKLLGRIRRQWFAKRKNIAGDPEGGADQRGVLAGRHRRREQGR
jgi:type IV secretion system protein VirB4